MNQTAETLMFVPPIISFLEKKQNKTKTEKHCSESKVTTEEINVTQDKRKLHVLVRQFSIPLPQKIVKIPVYGDIMTHCTIIRFSSVFFYPI